MSDSPIMRKDEKAYEDLLYLTFDVYVAYGLICTFFFFFLYYSEPQLMLTVFDLLDTFMFSSLSLSLLYGAYTIVKSM